MCRTIVEIWLMNWKCHVWKTPFEFLVLSLLPLMRFWGHLIPGHSKTLRHLSFANSGLGDVMLQALVWFTLYHLHSLSPQQIQLALITLLHTRFCCQYQKLHVLHVTSVATNVSCCLQIFGIFAVFRSPGLHTFADLKFIRMCPDRCIEFRRRHHCEGRCIS